MPAVISRMEARTLGLTRYFTGRACKHGHTGERYIKSGTCMACSVQIARAQRKRIGQDELNRRAREARIKKPLEVRERETAYYRRKAPIIRAQAAERWARTRNDPFTPEHSLRLAQHMVYTSRARAVTRNTPHSIQPKDLLPLPTHCPVFGFELQYGPSPDSRKRPPNQASLDEIIVGLGYVPGNCAVISMLANTFKSNMTLKELEKIYYYVKGHTA